MRFCVSISRFDCNPQFAPETKPKKKTLQHCCGVCDKNLKFSKKTPKKRAHFIDFLIKSHQKSAKDPEKSASKFR